MEYYLIMDGNYSSDKIHKLNATNMNDAKKEAWVRSFCFEGRFEIPNSIDYNNFDEWLVKWMRSDMDYLKVVSLGSDCVKDLVCEVKKRYYGYRKDKQDDDGLKKCCDEVYMGADVYRMQKATILEVNSTEVNLENTAHTINNFLRLFVEKEAKANIEKEEREKLEELKKKYGE